jgi:hypothetical protein
MARSVIANRVFVGYPHRTYKPFWEAIAHDLHARYPLHFLAMGREPGQPAAQLLVEILNALDASSLALFDASTGNANVSLEYGYAKATMSEASVYLFFDEESPATAGPGTPIISDLAGTIANRYTLGDQRLRETLDAIARRHPYTKRYEKFCRQRKYKGGPRKTLLRILRKLDGKTSILRRELLDDLVHETRRKETAVAAYLKALHEGGLITITRGNEFSSRVFIAG